MQLAYIAGGAIEKGTRRPARLNYQVLDLLRDLDLDVKEEEIQTEIDEWMEESGVVFE